jgi:hypothetical protein
VTRCAGNHDPNFESARIVIKIVSSTPYSSAGSRNPAILMYWIAVAFSGRSQDAGSELRFIAGVACGPRRVMANSTDTRRRVLVQRLDAIAVGGVIRIRRARVRSIPMALPRHPARFDHPSQSPHTLPAIILGPPNSLCCMLFLRMALLHVPSAYPDRSGSCGAVHGKRPPTKDRI